MEVPGPSRVRHDPWLWVERPKPWEAPNPGKWMIFLAVGEVEEWWERIAAATRAGRLGPAAKVSTRFDSPIATDSDEHVIIVYTGDHTDEEDVFRVRRELHELGVAQQIRYKTDEATTARPYDFDGPHVTKYEA